MGNSLAEIQDQFISTFEIKDTEDVDTIVLACISNRFVQLIQDFVKNDLGYEYYDLKTDAGAAKNLDPRSRNYLVYKWIVDNFKICVNRHGAKRLIMFMHFDCGAYGGNESFKGFEDQLTKLTEAIKRGADSVRKEFPELEISAYIMVLIDDTNGGILPVTL